MQTTPNLDLKKPEETDAVTPSPFNDNSDVLDAHIAAAETDIAALQADVEALLDVFYPVGTIYATVSPNLNTPEKMAAHFGGTWAAWGAGKVPVGVDTSQAEFETVEKSGGSKEVTLTAAQSGLRGHAHGLGGHTHSGTTTADQQNYGFGVAYMAQVDVSQFISTEFNDTRLQARSDGGWHIHDFTTGAATGNTGNVTDSAATAAHNNLQPYITCYMWKRTA